MQAEGSGLFEGNRHGDPETGAVRGPASEVAFDLPPGGIDLDLLERRLVEQALARTAGNKTRAGALLGLTRDQVRYRMQKYGLDANL